MNKLMMLHARIRPVLFISSLLALTGCVAGGAVDQLKNADLKDDTFPSALASEYLSYSESEKEMGHPIHADYFAAKGLKAAGGGVVEPETVSAALPTIVAEQLASARAYLLELLTDDMKRIAPQDAARAQLLFDCWVHQQSKHAVGEGVPCAQEYESAVAELEAVAESFAYTREMDELLTFAGKEATLSDEHLQALDEISYEVSSLLKYEVEIRSMPYGRSGSYHKIAVRRAEAVKSALVDRGVPPHYIEIVDSATAKTVYLSNDEEEQPRNTVKVIVKATNDEKAGE